MTPGTLRRLVVLRHAESAWPQDVADSERPLAPRGRRDAPTAGRWLREADCVPDLVVCSPARRTRQTWDLIAAESVAGVAMGRILRTTRDKGEEASPAARVSHLVHPISAGVAVPLFALFAAGVSISGPALAAVFTSPEPLGVVIGLVVGKVLGIFLGTYLAARFTKAQLNPDLAWADVLGLSVLAGIGFTVALLIGELAFPGQEVGEHVKAAVLIASLTAAVLLRRRNATCRRLWEAENIDADADGIPDIYQREADAPTFERN